LSEDIVEASYKVAELTVKAKYHLQNSEVLFIYYSFLKAIRYATSREVSVSSPDLISEFFFQCATK
jgi:hypothetical protein